jgi:hypothetical protein
VTISSARAMSSDERDNPACAVLDQYVYPVICPENQPKPLLTCIQRLNLRPENANLNPPQYNPDFGRIFCNLYRFVRPGDSCTTSPFGPGDQGLESSGEGVGEIQVGIPDADVLIDGPRVLVATGEFVAFRAGDGSWIASGACAGAALPDASSTDLRCYYKINGSVASGENSTYSGCVTTPGPATGCDAVRMRLPNGRIALCYQLKATFAIVDPKENQERCTQSVNLNGSP